MTLVCSKCEKAIKVPGPVHNCTDCKKLFHVTKCSNSIIIDENVKNDQDLENLSLVHCSKCIHKKLVQVDALCKERVTRHKEVGDLHIQVNKNETEISSLRQEISSLNQQFSTAMQQISALTQQFSAISQALQGLTERLENSCLSTQAIQPHPDELMKSVAEHMVELQEREKRKFNVLIRGVPEVLESAPNSDDTVKVRVNLFQRAMGIPADQIPANAIVSTRRVGRPSQDYPRHIIVTLDSIKTKIMILKAAPNLRGKALDNDGPHRPSFGLFVSPDYTKMQQEQQKCLRDEVKRRRAVGERVKIFRDRVVVVSDPRPGARVPVSLSQHVPREQRPPPRGHPTNSMGTSTTQEDQPTTLVGQPPHISPEGSHPTTPN